MFGLMQDQPLLVASIITHAARHHGTTGVISRNVEGDIHRTDYAGIERRARRLANVLIGLGVRTDDRVGTLAWNGFRHLELYYAISGMQAICHTINPRLPPTDIAFIAADAGDTVLFVETSFAAIVAAIAPALAGRLRAVVFMTDRANMPDIALPGGMDLLCYEELMAAADEDYAWPVFDERQAASLCYTSGTTGRPKGALYSHRSTLLHAYALNGTDTLALAAADRILPVVPMFHVNAWGTPYAAPMAGAGLVMPGRHLDGASLTALMNTERVTISAGVPTVWLGLLQHLRNSGERLTSVKRLVVGGSACPRMLMEAFADEYGIDVQHAWGMTETSPVGTFNRPKAHQIDLPREAALRLGAKQGRALFGVDMRIIDDAGTPLPWDGTASGHLQVKGPWVCSAYFGNDPGTALDAEGWFTTGDVASIDGDGVMEITDRSKDVIKSGGEWISSIALENVAIGHPDVAEAAIIAARHPTWDERPLLLVVAKTGHTIEPEALLGFIGQHVPRWMVPDAAVVVAELPHTATGKVHKLSLRARYGDYLVSNRAASSAK